MDLSLVIAKRLRYLEALGNASGETKRLDVLSSSELPHGKMVRSLHPHAEILNINGLT